MDVAESQALFNYIVKKEYPLNFTKDEKRRLREKSGSFCVSSLIETWFTLELTIRELELL